MKSNQYPRFSFAGRTLKYEPDNIKIYDPDSVRGLFPVEGIMYEHSFRIQGFDSIENKIKKVELQALSETQRQELINRRDYVLEYTKNIFKKNACTVKTYENDKYGRILCSITIHTDQGDQDLSELLIKSNMVFPYKGDTKLTLVQQAEFCISNPIKLHYEP